MLRLSNYKLPVDEPAASLPDKLRKLPGLEKLTSFRIVKKALDARSRSQAWFIYTVDIETPDEEQTLALKPWPFLEKTVPEPPLFFCGRNVPLPSRPLVIGSGPAGMFAALALAKAGARPLLLERGRPVSERQKDVCRFWRERSLNPESNVQFGEGGAGTFSDGKLMTGIKKDAYVTEVFNELVAAGAPEEILFLAKPHLGTDRLAQIVPNIRAKIISLGGEYRFNTRLDDLIIKNGRLIEAVVCDTASAKTYTLPADALILAVGHSARDTFEMLHRRGIPLQPKPFSLGVRIEHPQELINRALYHDFAGHPALGAADYKMAVHLPGGRSVYTFCMCPGGEVVAAASEPGRLVTNGMSCYARNKDNANAALLVGITPEDFGGAHPLQGMYFQRELESRAFTFGGSSYRAPAQRVEDFLRRRASTEARGVIPSYSCGVNWGELDGVLPPYVATALREALPLMDNKLRGFNYPDAVMTGIETRSSSPLKILRGTDCQSPVLGLYPCGEGAGYAGGIVSAAADGLKTALSVLQ